MLSKLIDRIVARIMKSANESFTRQTDYPVIEMIEQYRKFGVVAPHVLEKAESYYGLKDPNVLTLLERSGALETRGTLLIKDVVTRDEYEKLQVILGVVRKDLDDQKAICEEQLKIISKLSVRQPEPEISGAILE